MHHMRKYTERPINEKALVPIKQVELMPIVDKYKNGLCLNIILVASYLSFIICTTMVIQNIIESKHMLSKIIKGDFNGVKNNNHFKLDTAQHVVDTIFNTETILDELKSMSDQINSIDITFSSEGSDCMDIECDDKFSSDDGVVKFYTPRKFDGVFKSFIKQTIVNPSNKIQTSVEPQSTNQEQRELF